MAEALGGIADKSKVIGESMSVSVGHTATCDFCEKVATLKEEDAGGRRPLLKRTPEEGQHWAELLQSVTLSHTGAFYHAPARENA